MAGGPKRKKPDPSWRGAGLKTENSRSAHAYVTCTLAPVRLSMGEPHMHMHMKRMLIGARWFICVTVVSRTQKGPERRPPETFGAV